MEKVCHNRPLSATYEVIGSLEDFISQKEKPRWVKVTTQSLFLK